MNNPIPDEALRSHIAILGKTGSGKSNAAKTIVERAMDAGERVCVLDPTGAWFGLRLMANGRPSPYLVVIFGGQHADVPINGTQGAAVAEIIGTTSTPAVIDTRLMTVGDRTRFFTDFAEAIIRVNRGALTLVLDEAHVFAPQGRVADPQSGRMLHATNNLINLGRGIGLRIIMITQRPAKLHKDSLSAVETLVAMRLIAPQDRSAIKDWIADSGDAESGREIIASLPSLPTGDAWIWSPELGVLKRDRFPLARTFDSGKAPAIGDPSVILRPLDLSKIQAQLATVEADTKANDPHALKAEISRLTREVARLEKVKTAAPPAPVTITANADQIEAARAEGERVGIALGLARARHALDGLRVDGEPILRAARQTAPAGPAHVREKPVAIKPSEGVTGPQQRILNALAWWAAFGINQPTNEQVGFVAGYSPSSGGFANLKGGLRAAGLVDYPAGGRLALTDAGEAVASAPDMAPTQDAFHASVRAKLSGPQARVFDPILAAHPGQISSQDVANAAGYSAGSGGFANLRGSLKTIGLIDYPGAGQVRAADWLFPKEPA